jgi:hypothetical protein
MKKILLSVLVVLLLVVFVGCGKDNGNDAGDNNGGTNNGEVNNNSSSNSSNDEIKLYSDNTKMVFQVGNSKLVYYYSGEKITAYHAYVDYENAATANYALTLINLDEDSNIKKAYTQGRYVVIEYAESEYKDTTTSEIRALYSYLEQVQPK